MRGRGVHFALDDAQLTALRVLPVGMSSLPSIIDQQLPCGAAPISGEGTT